MGSFQTEGKTGILFVCFSLEGRKKPQDVKIIFLKPLSQENKDYLALMPMLKEMCASCLKPVYPMERVVTDKVCVHSSCFCCQVCGRKLSLQNYAALHGVFYCQVHYKLMAGAGSRSEMERLEHHHVQQGPKPWDWCNRAKETETREKPASFNAQCDLQLAEHRNSRAGLLGNKLRTVWPPSEPALAVDGKAGNGVCSLKKPALSLPAYQAAGSRAGRTVLRGQEGAVEKGRFLPGITYTKEREQVCSWPKNREQREETGGGDVPERKRGGKVSQRVAAIQQGQAQLKRRPACASLPPVLEPVKPLPRASLAPHPTHQSTKPAPRMYPGGSGVTEVPVTHNKVCGSLSTPSKGGTITEDKTELTIDTPDSAGAKHHLGEGTNSTQTIHVQGEPKKTRNTTNTELKYIAEDADPPENEAEQAHSPSGVLRTSSVSSGSLEPEWLGASPEITEMLNEKSNSNTRAFPGKQMPLTLGEDMQPLSISDLPGIESEGSEFEKTKEEKPVTMSVPLEEPSPEHTSQENEDEKSRVFSPGCPDRTDDHNVSSLQETECQDTCDPLKSNTHEGIWRQDTESSDQDFLVSTDTPLKETCATCPSHDKINNPKSKDSGKVLSENTLNISEQPAKTSEYSKPNASLDKSAGHPAGEEKVDLKLPGERTAPMSQSGAQSKEARSSQACRETSGKGFRLGKNPLITLFGSEDKGRTPRKETTTQRKPTKHQSALATLFGRSSEKKQSPQEKPAASSDQANIDGRTEKAQGLLSSSSQAKQNAPKNDQLPGKMEVFPKHIQESSGGFSGSTEGKETDVLLSAPSTAMSHDDKCGRIELDIHDQVFLNSQVWQQQDSCWHPVMPAENNQKEGAGISDHGTNPLQLPPELVSAADNSKNLTREWNHHDAHLPGTQNPLSLDVQDTVAQDGIFFSTGNSEKLPKDAEFQFGNMDFLGGSNLLFSRGQDFPSIAKKTPNSDLQNSEAETPSFFDPNPSDLFQEISSETNTSLELWDTSSLSLLDGQDEMNIRDLEGIQSCELLLQVDPQRQAPKAAEEKFGMGFSTEDSTKKHVPTQDDDFPLTYMSSSCASETSNQGVFDHFDVDSTKTGQEAPEKMNNRRKTSGAEEDYDSLSSEDLEMLNYDLSEKEFFI
ncbi:hypothetical protein DUI87_17887 [Hirundo rustica rustica]|uniref:LIM zinc-binding domain-containing protein n=2 Tax=Hirundo rustica TaxID=43150 RepID=A0A3M0KC17_HIRRU|nr:hypothetical protein DUI87_17887 [Hirundo rustica rustica]